MVMTSPRCRPSGTSATAPQPDRPTGTASPTRARVPRSPHANTNNTGSTSTKPNRLRARQVESRRSTANGNSPDHENSSTPTHQPSMNPAEYRRGTGSSPPAHPSTPSTPAPSPPPEPDPTTSGANAAAPTEEATAKPAASASPSPTTPAFRWTYCHGTQTLATTGDTLKAGQQIMTSGNTDRSGTPHVHIEIRTPTTCDTARKPSSQACLEMAEESIQRSFRRLAAATDQIRFCDL